MPGNAATHSYWVYVLTNRWNGTLYIGVTNDLKRRIWEHKTGVIPGFPKQYGLRRLIYLEEFRDVRRAIDREKQLKGWNRQRKLELLETGNPDWKDLSADWFGEGLDSSLRSE